MVGVSMVTGTEGGEVSLAPLLGNCLVPGRFMGFFATPRWHSFWGSFQRTPFYVLWKGLKDADTRKPENHSQRGQIADKDDPFLHLVIFGHNDSQDGRKKIKMMFVFVGPSSTHVSFIDLSSKRNPSKNGFGR